MTITKEEMISGIKKVISERIAQEVIYEHWSRAEQSRFFENKGFVFNFCDGTYEYEMRYEGFDYDNNIMAVEVRGPIGGDDEELLRFDIEIGVKLIYKTDDF